MQTGIFAGIDSIFIDNGTHGTINVAYADALIPQNGSPRQFSLEQNCPNPFNQSTRISFFLAHREDVEILICNLLGERIRGWRLSQQGDGAHQLFWDGTDEGGRQVASGTYYYRMRAGDFDATRQMVLVR